MAGSGHNFPLSGSLPGQIMASQGSVGTGFTQSQPSQLPGIQQQQQQSFAGQNLQQSTATAQSQMASPTKSVNSVALCKLGQDTNQELVTKLLEVFKMFKAMQLPNGTSSSQTQYIERRAKMEESLRQMSIVFKKLRVIYDKVSEYIVDPDENPEEVLVPLKGEPLCEKNDNTDAYRYASEEHKQLVEQLQQRNRQIKEVIDKIRSIMWEINTMIVMRKT